MLAPAAVVLTPWAVHEHGALTPELVALPLLLGAVLLVPRERRAPWLGLVCGVLPLVKVPYAIAGVALIAISAAPRRAAVFAAVTLCSAWR